MTLGSGVYFPSAKFWTIRAYLKNIYIRVDAPDTTFTSGGWSFTDPGNPNVHFRVVYDPEWLAWSSNKRTLDQIITESYYTVFPSPTQIPMPFALNYDASIISPVPSLEFVPFNLPFVARHEYVLESTLDPYWANGTDDLD